MSSVVSFGTNTNAQRKRVYFTGATAVYEGMPMCYDDSTTNVLGIDTGASNAASVTTTEGYLNEGRFLRVEIPAADNVDRFAGVVAHGPKVGNTGPCWLDIFIPNNAVVPVRTDVNCTKDITILAIETTQTELGVPVDASRPVAIARETLASTTARLILAELCPNKFMYMTSRGTALDMAAGVRFGKMDITTSSTSLVIGPQFKMTHTGTGASGIYATLIRATCEGTAIAGPCYANWSQVTLGTGAIVTSGYRAAGALLKTHVLSTAGTQLGDIYAAHFCVGLDKAVTGKTAQMYFESTTTVGEHIDYWFVTRGGSPGEDIGYYVNAAAAETKLGAIKIRLGYAADDGYIYVYDGPGSS